MSDSGSAIEVEQVSAESLDGREQEALHVFEEIHLEGLANIIAGEIFDRRFHNEIQVSFRPWLLR